MVGLLPSREPLNLFESLSSTISSAQFSSVTQSCLMGLIPDPIPHQLHLSGGLFFLLPPGVVSHTTSLRVSSLSCSYDNFYAPEFQIFIPNADLSPEFHIGHLIQMSNQMSNIDRLCHSSS